MIDISGVPWTRFYSRPHNDPLGRRGLLYKYTQVSIKQDKKKIFPLIYRHQVPVLTGQS
jgi:hypothetical protein